MLASQLALRKSLQAFVAVQSRELTRRFTKRNWVAFIIVNISELEKGNGELYMAHGNLNITMVYIRHS